MLGTAIRDPDQIESSSTEVAGLALLPVTTTFQPVESTHQVRKVVNHGGSLLQNATGSSLTGYEIHMGQTTVETSDAPFAITERSRRPFAAWMAATARTATCLAQYPQGLFHTRCSPFSGV